MAGVSVAVRVTVPPAGAVPPGETLSEVVVAVAEGVITDTLLLESLTTYTACVTVSTSTSSGSQANPAA